MVWISSKLAVVVASAIFGLAAIGASAQAVKHAAGAKRNQEGE